MTSYFLVIFELRAMENSHTEQNLWSLVYATTWQVRILLSTGSVSPLSAFYEQTVNILPLGHACLG